VVVFAVLIISPALFQPVNALDVVLYDYGAIDPVVSVEPTISGYDFIFSGGADDFPVYGLACNNSPYPYISAVPLSTYIGYDERMLLINGTRDVPYMQGLGSSTYSDSRVFLTNNDIWSDFREGARDAGEQTRYGGAVQYQFPSVRTDQGLNVEWGMPQKANQGGTITTQFPMIRTDYRGFENDRHFFTDDALTTWLSVDNGGREMLDWQGEIHDNPQGDWRFFIWEIKGGTSGGHDYFERETRAGHYGYENFQNKNKYFKITTTENDHDGGADVYDSYAYMLQWQPWIGNGRYYQGPDGYLDWRPEFITVTTGFPGSVLQETNALQLIGSFYLEEEGQSYTPQNIHKGDMMVTFRTSAVDEGEGVIEYLETESPSNVIPLLAQGPGNQTTYGDPQIHFLEVYSLLDPDAVNRPALTHINASVTHAGKLVGYHVRPVYDVFGESVEPRGDDTMYVPGYDFSNNKEVTCRPFVWGGGGIASPEVISYGNMVTVTPRFDCGDTYHLPNVEWVHNNALDFTDIVPDDYCTVRPENQEIPLPPTIVPGAVPVYRDIVMLVPDYSHDTSNVTARVDLKIIPENSPYSFSIEDYTTCGAYDPINGELGSFMTTDNKTAGLFTDFLGSTIPYVWFARDNPLVVNCQNLNFFLTDGSEPPTNVTFSKTLNADMPFYTKFLSAIEADDWGWGVGQSEISDQPGFAPYQNLIFGMPFVAVMGMLTAMIGFNRRHIPAAGISYGIVLGALTYFGLIDIPVAAFGAIVTFLILLIFSKGFR